VRTHPPSDIPAAPSPPRVADPAPVRLLPGLGRRPHVLLVDDEPAVRRGVARLLLGKGFEVDTAEDGQAALSLLGTRGIDVVLLDHGLPGVSGLSLLPRLKQHHAEVEVVLIKALGQPDTVAAARAGAFDVVDKPFDDGDHLALIIERAAERRRLLARTRSLEGRIDQHERLGELLGRSAKMLDIHRRALAAATSNAPVLILGEPGTGKELVARIIHRRSARAGTPLVTLDCGAIPEARLEAELFGDGDAGASSDEPKGLLALADRGTLFLDGIEALPSSAQARLAQALSERALPFAPAGRPHPIDLRILAAGSADLRERVADGRFRQDLFFRLLAIPLELPPLRRRREDIPLLAYHFLETHARRAQRPIRKISVEALRALRDHPWPGNVRELAAAIEHAVVLARGETILPADLPFAGDPQREGEEAPKGLALSSALVDLPYAEARDRATTAFDRAYAEHLLASTSGNVSEAARRAGMDRSNFRRLLKRARQKSRVHEDAG
jgi:DNA-binding NtrC family response regulator